MTSHASISVEDCFREGWSLYKREPLLLSGATLIVAALNSVAGMIPFANLLVYPTLLAGLYLLIMRLDEGKTPGFATLFDGFQQLLPLVLASLLISVFVTIGLILLVLPGLYLALAYGLTILFIVDRKLEFWPAMELSRKTVNAHFWPYALLAVAIVALTIVAAIPFGLGLLVSVPVCLAAQYRFFRAATGTELTL